MKKFCRSLTERATGIIKSEKKKNKVINKRATEII